MPGHTERDFETAIEAGLTGAGGYVTRPPGDFQKGQGQHLTTVQNTSERVFVYGTQ